MINKKLLITLLIFVLVAFVSAFSYLLGKMNANDNQVLSENDDSEIFDNKHSAPSPTISNQIELTITPTPNLKVKVITANAKLDGFRTSINSGNDSKEIIVGRNKDYVSRGFVSFNISDIPEGANIKESVLRIYQVKSVGNPVETGKQIKIDHLTYGDNLDINDYGFPALSYAFTEFKETLGGGGWKTAQVTNRVRDDFANARGISQFRIHFQSELTGGTEEGDFLYFESGENFLDSGKLPELVVSYTF